MPEKKKTTTKKSAAKPDTLAKAPQHAAKSMARAVPAKAKKSAAPAAAVEAFDRAKAAPAVLPSVLRSEDSAGTVVAVLLDPAEFIPSRFDVPHRDPDAELVESIRERGQAHRAQLLRLGAVSDKLRSVVGPLVGVPQRSSTPTGSPQAR